MSIADDIQFYTDWVNNEFRLSWKHFYVDDLIAEFSCGCSLVQFINAIFDEELPVIHKRPLSFYEKEQNIQVCLPLLREEEVNLTGITAIDVAVGDVDVILTLCAAIKRRKGVGFRRRCLFTTEDEMLEMSGPDLFSDNNLHKGSTSYMKPGDFETHRGYHFDDVVKSSSQSRSYCSDFDGQSEVNKQSNRVIPFSNQSDSFNQSNTLNKKSSLKKNGSNNGFSGCQSRSKYQEVSFLLSDSKLAGNDSDTVFYDKDDITMFDWLSTTLDVPIKDYGSFADGIVLYQLLCKIIPNCVSAKVFYSNPPTKRIQLVLETACHELYFSTNITADEIYKQRNFRSFRILLAYLKSFIPALPPNSRSHQDTVQRSMSKFTLDDLKSVCAIDLPDFRSRNPVQPNKKPIRKDAPPKFFHNKNNKSPVIENKPKNSLTVPDSRSQFVSPTWSKILFEELQMRASRNESRISSNNEYVSSEEKETAIPYTDSQVRMSPKTDIVTSKEKDTIPYTDLPTYTRDTDRITKYDDEIAAIFDDEDDNDDDDDERFDVTVDIKQADNSTTATEMPSSSCDVGRGGGGGDVKRNKFLDITSEVRSMSRSPSGSRNC